MAQRTAIGAFLTTCGFTSARDLNFIMENEGINRWIIFTLIDFDDLANVGNFAPFTIITLKLRYLLVLKFWIEDKIRMNTPHVVS